MNFTNEELVVIFKKAVIEKRKIDAILSRNFTIITKFDSSDPENTQLAAKAKMITPLEADRMKESVIYKSYESIIAKLQPVVEIILDSDLDIQHKFRNIS